MLVRDALFDHIQQISSNAEIIGACSSSPNFGTFQNSVQHNEFSGPEMMAGSAQVGE
jgi:hypothetical protein